MNKKAFMLDSIRGPIYIMVCIMTAFIAFYIWIAFSGVFSATVSSAVEQGSITASQNTTIQTAISDITGSLGYFDTMMPVLVMGLMLVSLIFAYRSGYSIVYSFVSIIIWIFALMLSAIYTNVFELFASNFATIGSQYVIMSFIMANMKWIVLCWLFVISITMFAKNTTMRESSLVQNQEGFM